jgi:serine protease Do
VKPGDVIVLFQGRSVKDSGELKNLVANAAPGSTVSFGVMRAGKELSIPVKIRNLDESSRMMSALVREKLGADVRAVTDDEREKYGLEDVLGVAVASLEPKGPLAKAGFEVGDVLVMVDGQPVDGVDGLAVMLDMTKSRQVVSIAVIDHKTGQAGVVKVEVR